MPTHYHPNVLIGGKTITQWACDIANGHSEWQAALARGESQEDANHLLFGPVEELIEAVREKKGLDVWRGLMSF